MDRRLETIGGVILRYSLVFFFGAFGLYKFTAAEAQGIQSFMANSPFFSWLYQIFSLQGASNVIGVIEVATAIMIALRHVSPKVSALGSLCAAFALTKTLSFLITTPGIASSPSDMGLLMKDLTLLGAALWSAGEALRAANLMSGASVPRTAMATGSTGRS